MAETLPLIFLSRVIDGATAGNLSIAQAYISDVTAPKDRAKSFAVIGIAFGLGFLVGPAVSGFLSQFGYHYPVFAAAGLSFLSILATQFLLPKSDPRATSSEPGPGGKRLSFNKSFSLPSPSHSSPRGSHFLQSAASPGKDRPSARAK
jgi:MFS family permease